MAFHPRRTAWRVSLFVSSFYRERAGQSLLRRPSLHVPMRRRARLQSGSREAGTSTSLAGSAIETTTTRWSFRVRPAARTTIRSSATRTSTPATLRGGQTTCDLEADSSTYWTPTLYEAAEPVPPLAAILYYTRHTTGPIVSMPDGLKMIAGDVNARRPQQKSVVSWSCGGGAAKRFVIVQQCSEESALVLNVRFPNCWNGRATDSADHKRHMTYSSAGTCPASHPARLPTISLALIYPSTSRHARLSSGKFAAHADFMNGWDDNVLSRLVAALND